MRRLILALLAVPAPALADTSLPPSTLAYTQLHDAEEERRAKALMESLRCPVCQGQSIADSDADMAGEMRALVRQRVGAGEAPEDVRRWLVSRYGPFISYDPGLSGVTWPLWASPAVLLLLGLVFVRSTIRKR